MVITISKSLPSSNWYTGTGSTTISLSGLDNITMNTKKSLIKIQVPQSEATYTSASSDTGKNYVKDLKKIEDTIKIRGWLADNTSSSAWNQAWQLRGMCASGGVLTGMVIENISFGTASQQAFLEEVNFIAHPNRAQGLLINETNSSSMGKARVEVDLAIYLGDAR